MQKNNLIDLKKVKPERQDNLENEACAQNEENTISDNILSASAVNSF